MLRLSLLGPLRLSSDETPINLATPPKTLLLLAYLLLHRHEAFTRDRLASALWPDRSDADARGQLRRYLYRLRQLLPEGDWLIARGEQVQWNTAADYWLDVEEFEREIGGLPDRLEAALALYTGDLLIDLYEDWIIIEREQLRELYLGGLQRLLDHYRDRCAYDRAIACALQILKREPLRENIVRELMQLRAASGDRNRALADYRQFQQRVIEELGVQPLPETLALYEQLRRAAISPDTRLPSSTAPNIRARPVKVPAPLTRLLGREHELNAVCDLLQSGECGVRLVTLTGPGGTGKTRLAQAAAQRLAQQSVEFEDGLYYVSLSSLTSPDFVLPAIAKALEAPENSQRSLSDAVKETLRHKDLLLILDNFEHLLEAAPLITDFLAVSADLRVLVTSREALHLYGEHEYEVPPLPLPDLDHLPPPNELLNDAAIALFVERARAVKADFVLTPDNAAAVAEICVRLDGLPLAIELAAARSKLFTPQAMLQRLTDRLRFLVGQSRDRPDRQRTLRSVIDWSYNLLSDEEKRLFARLSVFAGSFTAEAVKALGLTQTVWIGGNPPDVMERLSALIDKHMLRAVKLGEAEQESRFRMLLTLREYAQERLSVRGEFETLQNRHLQYRLALAQESAIGIGGAQQADWLRRLDADRDNFRAVLSWALEQPNRSELGLQLTVALGKFWTRHGDWTEGAQWLKRALAQNPKAEPVWRARALNIASELADLVGNTSESDTLAAESLALFRSLGERRGLADALCNMGGTRLTQNDHARAEPLLLEALALYREINSPAGAAQVLSYLGMLAKEQADFERAAAYFEESLELNRQLGDALGMAQNLGQLGTTRVSHAGKEVSKTAKEMVGGGEKRLEQSRLGLLVGRGIDGRRKVGRRHGDSPPVGLASVYTYLEGQREKTRCRQAPNYRKRTRNQCEEKGFFRAVLIPKSLTITIGKGIVDDLSSQVGNSLDRLHTQGVIVMLSLYSRVSLIFVVLMSVCVPVSASAYGPPTIRDSQVLQSLGELLNADGSLNMNSGFTGSLDARGYQLIAEQNRAPRFLKIDPQVSSDVNWDDRFGNPGVNPDEVRAVAVSDIGIFVGGTFLQAAQVDSASILRWDGRRWHDMGGGVKYSSGTNAAVNAIVVSGNKVYVGGRFDLAGNLSVSNLAVWDGTTWADMAGGAKTGTAEAAEVFALTVKNGFVFVGGRFQTVGTVTANGVARWSEGSSTWSSLGTGLAGNIINPQGTARAFAQGGNFLYVGGEFVSAGGQPAAHIARWDTVASSWSALGSGMASSSIPGVYALAYDGSNLYAGGRFDTAGGVSAMNIAQWNGSSWVALGSGISAPLNVIPVRSLMLSPNGLLVGGEFSVAGGKAAMNLAYWNGAGWDPHEGVGMDSTTPVVYALAAVGEGFYAGGNFLKAGVKWINHIAFWSGGEWLALGQGLGHGAGHNTAGGEIRAVAVNQHGQVYVGGMFSYAGGVPTNNIARWDGANWHPLGSGVDLPVNALAVSGDDLYAGGEFFTAGGETVNNVARWNEADQVWYAMGGGVSNVVRALAAGGGWLYVGGDFITADSQYAWGVARWNLAEHQWQMLPASFPDQVWSIAVEGDRVVIGGKFETMALGGITYQVNRIVIWNTAENVWYRLQDNGSVGVFNNIVFALAIHGDNIYAGGTFASAGARPNTTGLARYDLNAGRWYSVGTGIAGGYSWVYSFEVFGDNLFVGGDFSHAGGQLVNKIARWDINNQSWSSLGSGLGEVVVGGVIESSVYALKMSAGRLNMGGKFVTVGGVPSHNFAQWQQASPAALALVTPLEGGTLSATDIQIQFPSQAVSESVTVSYTPLSPALVTGVKQFNLEAHTQSGQLVTNFNQNYTLAVGYSDAELAALGINENDLALSYWDGAAWVNLPAVREPENNRIVLTANHFSTFTLREDKAVVVYTLYLPTIRNK